MASGDAKAIPVKAAAYRVTFPLLDADGDLVTGAGSLDSEVSKDAGTFADCTNEATEIATSSGMYYLDLTSSEMDADTVAIIVKSSSAKTTPIVLYTAARSVNDLAFPTTTGRSIDVTATGEVGIDWANIGGPTTTVNLSGTTVKTATDVETDTQDIQSRLPAALTAGGNIKADALAISGDTTAADNLESYTDGTTPMPVNVTQVSGDATAADNLEADYDGTGYNKTASTIATTTNVTNAVTVTGTPAVNVTQISGDSTAADNAESFFDGTGYAGTNNVIPSVTTVTGNVNGSVASVTGNVGGNVAGSTASVTAAVTVGTNNDKTGYALSTAGVDAVWDDTDSELSADPGAAPSPRSKLQWIYQKLHNIVPTTSSQTKVSKADGTVIGTASVSDDGTTATRGKYS